jgi:hypothetical protein
VFNPDLTDFSSQRNFSLTSFLAQITLEQRRHLGPFPFPLALEIMGESIVADKLAIIYSQLRPDRRTASCLKAGHPTDELQIELSTVSLNNYPNYEALSYV